MRRECCKLILFLVLSQVAYEKIFIFVVRWWVVC
jgi:hypothetical protein